MPSRVHLHGDRESRTTYGLTSGMHAVVFPLLVSLAGCLYGSGHENFVKSMQAEVGMRADDPYAYRNQYRNRRVSVRDLPNGNIEEKYDRHPKCPVFFEINKTKEEIVGWRYEGTEKDCVIVP